MEHHLNHEPLCLSTTMILATYQKFLKGLELNGRTTEDLVDVSVSLMSIA